MLGGLYTGNYVGYVNNVLKRMLMGFFVKGRRFVMLLTMVRMKEITGQMMKQANVGNL
jgi:hypothetical protein